MIDIQVKVSGPGEAFNAVVEAIYVQLLRRGAMVTLLNEFPTAPPSDDLSAYHITLKADHQPWGG